MLGSDDESATKPLWRRLFPIADQLARYDREKARDDLVAGLTVAVLLVPQAMAYAMLAGLDPIVGLYASTLPLLAYAVVGSSPQLSVGPVALMALVMGDAIGGITAPGTAAYLGYALVLAVLVGAMQLIMSVVRLGFVVDLLSHPVIVGFSAAAALIIAASQVGAATGLELTRTHRLDVIAADVFAELDAIHLVTLGIFGGTLALLVLLGRFAPKVPRALVGVGLATIVVWWFGLDATGVAVVGDIPEGLPELVLPDLGTETVVELLPAAAIALLVGFTEAFSIAKVLSVGDREVEVDANRELMGLGLANLASSVVGGMAVGGALSRTTVAHRSGARTQVSIVVAAIVVVATLLFLTPAFRLLPRAALAAVIVVAVMGLVDVAEARRLWKVDRRDFGVVMVTFASTLVLGVMWGVLVGVSTALLLFLGRVARPEVVRLELQRLGERRRWVPESEGEDERAALPGGAYHEDVLVLRIQAPAFFANARFLQESIHERIDGLDGDLPRGVILDASAIDHLDASAEMVLQELHDELDDRGVELHLARVTTDVCETMRRSGLADRLDERVHLELDLALQALLPVDGPTPSDRSRRSGGGDSGLEAPRISS